MFLFIKVWCVSCFLHAVAVSLVNPKDLIHFKITVRSHPQRHRYVGCTKKSKPNAAHLPCYIRVCFTHSLPLVVVHSGPSYSAICLTFTKHPHSDVNSIIAIVSNYDVMGSLKQSDDLIEVQSKLQLIGESRLSSQ